MLYDTQQFWISWAVAAIAAVAAVRFIVVSKIKSGKIEEAVQKINELELVLGNGVVLHSCATVDDIARNLEGVKCWLYDPESGEFTCGEKRMDNSEFKTISDKKSLEKIAPVYLPDGAVAGFLESAGQSKSLVQLAALVGVAITSVNRREKLLRDARKINDIEQQLAKTSDIQKQFISNVSHELRTPLTSIKAYSEALTTPGSKADAQTTSEFLSIISQESSRLDSIINNLLDFSRLEREQVVLNNQRTDLVALVRGVEGGARSEAESRNIKLKASCSEDRIELIADDDLLRQMVRHLLDNALKFTPDGGEISLTVSEGVSSVRISVEDNGLGVPENELAYLFDRFYQVDGSTTRKHGGQGIGLSICKEIVGQHGGRIWGEKVVPAGMRFNIVLPRKNEINKCNTEVGEVLCSNQQAGFISELIHWVAELMRSRVVSIMLPDNDQLIIAAAMGLPENRVQDTRIHFGEGVAGKAWETGKTILVNGDISGRNYKGDSALSVPLFHEGRIVAVVNVTDRIDNKPFCKHEQLLLESVGEKLINSLDKIAKYRVSNNQFLNLRDTLKLAVAVRRARADSISQECKDLCLRTAARMNLSEKQIASLAMALQVYDLGVSGIPEPLLNKPGALLAAEWEIIRGHLQTSCEHAQVLGVPLETVEIIRYSHERFNGSGYPEKLSGQAIPLGARLLAVSDALTAMLQGRPWKKAKTLTEALKEIDVHQGKQFCPDVVSSFQEEIEINGLDIVEKHSRNTIKSR
ncbi:GAF domain-containing protein [bacterium]|nr:GAF domain-containing protein [bacterium]